jgi:phosphoglycerate dehydrogenase-like enzyme
VSDGYTGAPTAVVFDPYPSEAWATGTIARTLRGRGVDWVVPDSPANAASAIAAADVVMVTGFRRLDAAAIASLDRCVGILCYSIGMDQVDARAAAARRITVANIPDYCTDEVADHAMALLLAAERRLTIFTALAAAGIWRVHDHPELLALRRLRGQTLGIIGAGRIGRAVGERARAFGLRTIAADPSVKDAGDGLEVVSLETLLTRADAVVVCASLTESTRDLLDRAAFERLRDGAILVNVARGGLIDEAALLEALDAGRIAVAALDVRAHEPPDPSSDPLARHPHTILTQHIAASSQEAGEDIATKAADRILSFLERAGRIEPADLARSPG